MAGATATEPLEVCREECCWGWKYWGRGAAVTVIVGVGYGWFMSFWWALATDFWFRVVVGFSGGFQRTEGMSLLLFCYPS